MPRNRPIGTVLIILVAALAGAAGCETAEPLSERPKVWLTSTPLLSTSYAYTASDPCPLVSKLTLENRSTESVLYSVTPSQNYSLVGGESGVLAAGGTLTLLVSFDCRDWDYHNGGRLEESLVFNWTTADGHYSDTESTVVTMDISTTP